MDSRRAYIEKNPQKTYCHRQVRAAIDRGDLVRPSTCSQCGRSGRIEGHHPDYNKPLDVIWLCRSCHAKESPGINAGNRYAARLTEDDVRVIHMLRAEGLGARRIAKLVGCSPTTAGRIFRRETWKDVE